MQTSTITVAVLPEPSEQQLHIDQKDISYVTTRSGGCGGQSVNTTDSAVIATHKPSGTSVRCESERSQKQNLAIALATLRARIWGVQKKQITDARNKERKDLLGSGMRGDKKRTISYPRGTVVDHITGKTWRLKDYLRGDWK